jgi:hypothetical protein
MVIHPKQAGSQSVCYTEGGLYRVERRGNIGRAGSLEVFVSTHGQGRVC